MKTIPIFPLNTVLYPEGILPLRIFEPRYLDMVSECLKQKKDFGVCLIRNGQETGKAANVHEIGTTAKITDWDMHDDGTLLITAIGQQRFRWNNYWVRPNQLLEAEVHMIEHEDDLYIPAQYQLFSDLLRQVVEKFNLPYVNEHEKYDDPYWVGCRLAEILPVELDKKQLLLEMDDPIYRLSQLQDAIEKIDFDQNN